MTQLAELWNRLTTDEKNAAYVAVQDALGHKRGDELVMAVHRHAEAHATSAPPYQVTPDTEPHEEPARCQDCGRPVQGKLLPWPHEEHGSRRPIWIGEQCYRDRLLRRKRGPEVAGDQTQIIPTPTQEES